VPTVSEAGLSGFACEQRYGLVAPAGTPPPIITRLNRELQAAPGDETLRRWGGIVRKPGLRRLKQAVFVGNPDPIGMADPFGR
jgi:hypothetical protein